MDNKTRIEKLACDYMKSVLRKGEPYPLNALTLGFIDEYNKGWNDAIEACKKQLSSTTEVDKILESLKIANC